MRINLGKTGGVKKIVLKGVSESQFKKVSYSTSFAGCRREVSIIAPRNGFIPNAMGIFDRLRGKESSEPFKLDNVECQDISFELDIDGHRRSVSFANLTNIGTNVDITSRVKTDNTGYPVYASLREEAHIILSYITER